MRRFASLAAASGVMAALSICVLALAGGASAASGSAAATALPTITIGMTGNSITVGGTLQSGAVNIVSTTSGEATGEPTLLYLKPGATFAQAFAAARAHNGDPNYLDPYGSIVFDANAPKGTSTAQTVLQPGTYVAVDTTKNNPAKWPHTQFTVTQSAAPAALPAPSATITAIEFNFRGPGVLHDGTTVRFQNGGFLVHMAIGVRVKNLQTAKQLTALLLAGKDNQAQKLALSFGMFMGPMSTGGLQQFTLHAKPGIWVLLCFMDTQDGREHTQLGMERTIRIVK